MLFAEWDASDAIVNILRAWLYLPLNAPLYVYIIVNSKLHVSFIHQCMLFRYHTFSCVNSHPESVPGKVNAF